MKKNGFSWPFHPYQILSWCAYLFTFSILIVGILPKLEKSIGNIFLYIFVFIFQISVCIIALFCTISDPKVEVLDENEA